MGQSNIFAVIFDMDGVLVDSTKHIWESFNQLAEPLGVHFDEMAIRRYLGNSMKDQIVMWREDYGVDFGNAIEFSIKAHKIQMGLTNANSKPDKELLRLLQDLQERNVPMAVGTSSGRVRADNMLSVLGIDHYFDAVITADDVIEHKPNPHVFLEAAKQINASPVNCVVIEDAATGIEAARNGHMKSIGFLTEWNSEEELSQSDMVIRGFGELSYNKLASMFDELHHATK